MYEYWPMSIGIMLDRAQDWSPNHSGQWRIFNFLIGGGGG